MNFYILFIDTTNSIISVTNIGKPISGSFIKLKRTRQVTAVARSSVWPVPMYVAKTTQGRREGKR